MSGPPPTLGRGRGRGRGPGIKPQQQQPQSMGRGPPPAHVPPPQTRPQPQPGVSQQGGGDALAQKLARSQISGRPGNGNGNGGNGNGNGGSGTSGRSMVRGRKYIDCEAQVLKTRPAELVSKQGKAGAKLSLRANFFKIAKRPDWELYQYRVDFSAEEDRAIVKRAWLNEHKARLGKSFVFDGTVLFTVSKLTQSEQPLQLVSKRKENDEPVTINIKFVGLITEGSPVLIQIFNLILRRCMGKLELQLVGRNLFDAKQEIKITEHKVALWPGYLTSIRQYENDLLMNCEFTHKVLRTDTAYDVLLDCSKSGDVKRSYQLAIVGETVMTPYNNKTYRVDDVDFDASPMATFSTRNGDVTYVSYYFEKYGIRIQSTKQPLLLSRAKSRDIRGGKAEMLYLIPELCNMTGLTDNMRSNFTMMKSLAQHMFIKPRDRVMKLNAFNKRLLDKPEIKAELNGWDIQLSSNLIQLNGRELNKEDLIFGNDQRLSTGPEANWTRTSIGKPMLVNANFNSWVVVLPAGNMQRDAQSFVQTINKVAIAMRFRVPQPEMLPIQQDRANNYCDAVDQIMNKSVPDLILFVVKNNNVDRYSAIKKKCYVDRAISSQVVLAKNLAGKNCMTVATKVAIQLNCKLGGAPWTVEIPSTDCMVVGFDVCHDKQDKSKSYGALVATLNKPMTSWFSTVAHHSSGEELCNTVAQDLIKACKKYHEINGKLPGRIMFYRDGVGDGQLGQVYHHEVEKVKSALTSLYGGETWKLAYIIVTKRINARLFKDDGQFANVAPGTIVDEVITLPEKYDFYLVSQHPMQGTASPVSYNVLSDNVGWSADIIQRLTYKLTHLYYNFSGTVTVPAPCQYAHKLAFLVGQNLHKAPNVSLSDRLYFI